MLGYILDNLKLFQIDKNLTQELRDFSEILSILNQTNNIQKSLEIIFNNISNSMKASRATIFYVCPETQEISIFHNIGSNVILGIIFAETCLIIL